MCCSVVTDPFSRSIKPFCVRITVRGRRSLNDYGEALNSLSFLNLTRGGRQTHRQQNELNVEDATDDVSALRVALHELVGSLPNGALITSEEDLVGTGANGSASKASGSASKGNQFIWTEACKVQWTNHLMEATGPQHLMEALIVLEHCLHPEWLKPWYASLRKAYAMSHAHLLRSPTVGAVALHLFVLDKAIMYDKEKVAPRNMRSLGGRNSVRVIAHQISLTYCAQAYRIDCIRIADHRSFCLCPTGTVEAWQEVSDVLCRRE